MKTEKSREVWGRIEAGLEGIEQINLRDQYHINNNGGV